MLLANLFLVLFLTTNEICSEGLTFISGNDNQQQFLLTPNETTILDSYSINGTGIPIGRTFLLLNLLKEKIKKFHTIEKIPTTPDFSRGCICVAFYMCGVNGTIISDGKGSIDIRFRPCTQYEICCYIRIVISTTPPPPSTLPTTVPTTPPPPPTMKPTMMMTTTTTTTVKPFVCCLSYPGVVPVPVPNVILATSYQPSYILPQPQIVVQPPAPVYIPSPPIVLPAPSTPALPPIVYGQSCVCMVYALCSLGYMPASQMGSIDPRLVLGRQGQAAGTCGADSTCCKIQQDNANQQAAQQQIGFSKPSESIVTLDVKNQGTPNACTCIQMDQCANGQAVTYDGIGAIDPRFGPCMSSTLVCCRLQGQQRANVIVGPPNASNPDRNLLEARVSLRNLLICGLHNATYAPTTPTTPGSTYFAEFPWMAMLLIRRPGSMDVFQSGGSLITSRVILTAAHSVTSCDPATLVARLGEWDTRVTTEPLPFQEVNAQRIVIHPQYHAGTLYNDVALVILSKAVTYGVNVRPVCLPEARQVFAEGMICYATGWGRNTFGADGAYQAIMRKVDLPIVSNDNCQIRLRQTRLGPSFQLHPSFMCAGGVESKDTCQKDGGGPLVCQNPQSRKSVQVGIVSWGIGCGDKTPGVYASVAQAQQWITQQLHVYDVAD